MKSQLVLTTLLALTGISSLAALTPLNLAEKSSYRLTAMVQKKDIPAYMSTDLSQVQINQNVILPNGETGTSIVLLSPSNKTDEPNSVTVYFSAAGKIIDATSHIVASAGSPIFIEADGAKLLDLAAEAVVDHFTEDPGLMEVANGAQSIDVEKKEGALFSIHMKDGRTYKVLLSLQGELISKGF